MLAGGDGVVGGMVTSVVISVLGEGVVPSTVDVVVGALLVVVVVEGDRVVDV